MGPLERFRQFGFDVGLTCCSLQPWRIASDSETRAEAAWKIHNIESWGSGLENGVSVTLRLCALQMTSRRFSDAASRDVCRDVDLDV